MLPDSLRRLRADYNDGLLSSTVPFWLKHGPDTVHGGLYTGLGETGELIDTDKAVWLQGRAAWTFSTLCLEVRRDEAWLALARSCLAFIERHCRADNGKLYFSVTADGKPLRMRRYVFSECFAAIGNAAYAAAAGDAAARASALKYFSTFLTYSFKPGYIPAKTDAQTRPMKGLAPLMIAIVTAQQIRQHLGDVSVDGATCAEWIDRAISEIETDFYHPEEGALMETVGPKGEIIDHFDGRTLNPGHAIECAWFILHEAKHRSDARLRALGVAILDCMWERGWDRQDGGLLYFTDLRGKPVQEYWAEMKFWWPHNEAKIATLLAWQMTGEARFAERHAQVHAWSHSVFADAVHGEWFGYAHRDGTISTRLKGNLWKGPFHLPRMQLYCRGLVDELLADSRERHATPGS